MQTAAPQTEVSTRRYCEDCRFCEVPAAGIAYARCSKAEPIQNGDKYVARQFDKPGFAGTQRNNESACGPNAIWFEPAGSKNTLDNIFDIRTANTGAV